MALAYLLDPCQQYQNRAGVNNVAGYLEVFRMDTDDRATVYVDFNGTLAPEHIGIDIDGRAVMIVESGRPYRVEMHGPNGDLFWTQQPVWPLAGGGGGVSGTDVVSTDGSISVDRTTVGSVTTYDLSANVEDSTDLLNWIRCEGATHIDGGDIWKPTYAAGTMVVGTRGIQVSADQFYHVTAHVRATKTSASPYYDNVYLLYSLDDGTSVTPVTRQSVIVDCSLGLSQDFEFSTDVMVTTDGELLFSIVGQDQAGISFDVLNMELHRVFSGAPYIPGGVADKPWVENNYQEKLTAGANITIDENNVISASGSFAQVQADWTENDSSSPAYIKHRPDLDAYATDAELAAGLATKQGVINDLDQIRSGAAAGSTAVQPAVLAPVATTGDYDSLTNKPTIPSGTQLVPAATSVDADKVLTVDSQGVPAWAAAQAPITVDQTYDPTSTNPQSGTAVAGAVAGKQDTLTAGSNISISGSTISATDTTYSAGTGLDLTGTTFSVDSTTVAMKSDLPDLTDYVTDSELSTILQGYQEALTAGSNIQISNGTISATDTTYTAGTGLDLTGTVFSVDTTTIATKSDLSSYTPTSSLAAVALSNDYDDLSNKPTIPVVPPTKELVAGSNITITEGANDVTVACTVTIGTVSI